MDVRFAVKSPWMFACVLAAAYCLPGRQSKADEPATAADSMLGKKPGAVRDDNLLKAKLVWCPPGSVTMEQVDVVQEQVATNDDPAPKARRVKKITPVKVFVTRGYWLGKYEVTQAEWKRVMATEPWKRKEETIEADECPATYVSWDDAMAFCRTLTQQERKAGRLSDTWEYTLPTEAQWERACRARTETEFSFGDDLSQIGDFAWIQVNTSLAGEQYAHRVGQKRPNPWGLHDMHGNVWEWCRDDWTEKLPGGRDPEVTEQGSSRVNRGGSWTGNAAMCRSAFRGGNPPSLRIHNLGFRVALSSVPRVK